MILFFRLTVYFCEFIICWEPLKISTSEKSSLTWVFMSNLLLLLSGEIFAKFCASWSVSDRFCWILFSTDKEITLAKSFFRLNLSILGKEIEVNFLVSYSLSDPYYILSIWSLSFCYWLFWRKRFSISFFRGPLIRNSIISTQTKQNILQFLPLKLIFIWQFLWYYSVIYYEFRSIWLNDWTNHENQFI